MLCALAVLMAQAHGCTPSTLQIPSYPTACEQQSENSAATIHFGRDAATKLVNVCVTAATSTWISLGMPLSQKMIGSIVAVASEDMSGEVHKLVSKWSGIEDKALPLESVDSGVLDTVATLDGGTRTLCMQIRESKIDLNTVNPDLTKVHVVWAIGVDGNFRNANLRAHSSRGIATLNVELSELKTGNAPVPTTPLSTAVKTTAPVPTTPSSTAVNTTAPVPTTPSSTAAVNTTAPVPTTPSSTASNTTNTTNTTNITSPVLTAISSTISRIAALVSPKSLLRPLTAIVRGQRTPSSVPSTTIERGQRTPSSTLSSTTRRAWCHLNNFESVPGNCRKYQCFSASTQKKVVRDCPDGKVFDARHRRCDFRRNVPACQSRRPRPSRRSGQSNKSGRGKNNDDDDGNSGRRGAKRSVATVNDDSSEGLFAVLICLGATLVAIAVGLGFFAYVKYARRRPRDSAQE